MFFPRETSTKKEEGVGEEGEGGCQNLFLPGQKFSFPVRAERKGVREGI